MVEFCPWLRLTLQFGGWQKQFGLQFTLRNQTNSGAEWTERLAWAEWRQAIAATRCDKQKRQRVTVLHIFGLRELGPAFSTPDSSAVKVVALTLRSAHAGLKPGATSPRRVAASKGGDELQHSKFSVRMDVLRWCLALPFKAHLIRVVSDVAPGFGPACATLKGGATSTSASEKRPSAVPPMRVLRCRHSQITAYFFS
jgi:hypothetical protein